MTQEYTPVRRLIRTLSLLSTLSLVAAALVVLGPGPTPAGAQTGTRPTTTTVSCTPASVTAGATTTCTVQVNDTGSGSAANPTGVVSFAVTAPASRTSSFAVIAGCTVTAGTKKWDGSCSGTAAAKIVLLAAGTLTLQASYPGSTIHAASSGTQTITVTGPSNPVTNIPRLATSGGRGNAVDVYGAACTAAGGEWGGFGNTVDPNTSSSNQQFLATSTRADGGLVASIPIPAESVLGTTYARFYCASAPVTSIGAPQITWLGPLITYTVVANPIASTAGPQVVLPRSIRPRLPFVGVLRVPDRAVVTAAGTTRVVVSQEPDALPAKDVLGLAGIRSAQLKSRTDANEELVGRVSRLAFAVLGRVPTRTFMDQSMFWTALGAGALVQWNLAMTPEFRAQFGSVSTDDFVRNAYLRTIGRLPSASEVRSASWRLTSAGLSRIGFLAELAQSQEARGATATRTYVLAAYQALTTVMPSQADLERFTGQLTDLVSKVQLVEDVALTRATPDRWNAAMSRPFGEWTRF